MKYKVIGKISANKSQFSLGKVQGNEVTKSCIQTVSSQYNLGIVWNTSADLKVFILLKINCQCRSLM